MVVNYSKWDALELSDDSDIEVHPNVDKRSFIRAKQNQIHQARHQRRHEIKTLKYERIINDGMLERIDTLLASLRNHAAQATGGNPDEFMMQALMECAGDPNKDKPPEPPEGVHYNEEQPLYSQMIAGLVDQVKKEAGSEPKDWYKSYVEGVRAHKEKVQNLQKQLLAKLNDLEKEEASKITSDSIHEGFNTSSVQKEKPKQRAKTVEVINTNSGQNQHLRRMDSGDQTPGADGDVDEPLSATRDGEDDIEPTKLGKEFAKIKMGDYRGCLNFISDHHEVVAERETDGLLMEAFNAQSDGKDVYAKQCVHQALLLQYCRSLGKDGVGLFFKRVTTANHNAQKVFLDDVNSTYARIRTRTAELAKERAANPKGAEQEVEQIQLHAVEPGTEIHINVPQPNSTDEVEQRARIIYEQFPPGLQRALASGSLERVNEVLGKMSVSEAEEVVERLGEGGMLSLEQGVIDGTTEEGQNRLKELEREAREGKEVGGSGEVEEAEVGLKELDVKGAVEVADVD